MEKQIISKRISSILDDISRLSSALHAMNTTDIQRYPDNYEILSLDAALRSEYIACRMRHLIYASTGVKKATYLHSSAAVLDINIRENDGILEITIPCLLPKRRQRKSTEFLLDPLYFALDQYTENIAITRHRHCVVCFSHIYDQNLPIRRIRDYDNIELKEILDVISTFIMVDDTGLLCDAYNTTELGDTDCTCISVMSKDRFPEWLDNKKNQLESIKDFE